MVTQAIYLAPAGSTRDVYLGRAVYSFKGGRSLPVPDALAVRIKKTVNNKGEPLFKITGLPEVVSLQKDTMIGGQLTCFN